MRALRCVQRVNVTVKQAQLNDLFCNMYMCAEVYVQINVVSPLAV
jgi:hypothetical protein